MPHKAIIYALPQDLSMAECHEDVEFQWRTRVSTGRRRKIQGVTKWGTRGIHQRNLRGRYVIW